MTMIEAFSDRLQRLEREQAATIARLERELAENKEALLECIKQRGDGHVREGCLRHELAEARGIIAADDERLRVAAWRLGIAAGCDAADHLADLAEGYKADAEALRALAAWSGAKRYNRAEFAKVQDGWMCILAYDYEQRRGWMSNSHTTLAAAIMDALGNAQ